MCLAAVAHCSYIVLWQGVVLEDGVLVNGSRVPEVLPPSDFHVVHGKELKRQQTQDTEWQRNLGGSLIPEYAGVEDLL